MFLLIDNYDSFTYNVFQSLSALGVRVDVHRNDLISLDEIEGFIDAGDLEGIIMSPGPGKPRDAGICIPLIKRFSGVVPILGICLGHQAIAEAFGGDVIPSDDVAHGKETFVFHCRDSLYKNMPLPFEGGRYHSLMVSRDTLPDVLKVEAENGEGLVMGFRHKSHDTFGVQFHPESVLTPAGSHLFEAFIHKCQSVAKLTTRAA